MNDLFGQIQPPTAFRSWAATLLPPAAFGLGIPSRRRGRSSRLGLLCRSCRRARFGGSLRRGRLAVGLGRFGFTPKLLLLEPSQLPFERSDLLHTPSDQNQQLRDDPLGGLSLFFPLLLALDSSDMLAPIIMSRLAITQLPHRWQ